jgi:plastocyanin
MAEHGHVSERAQHGTFANGLARRTLDSERRPTGPFAMGLWTLLEAGSRVGLSRRDILRFGVAGLAAIGLAGLLTACDGVAGEGDQQQTDAECPPDAIGIAAPQGAAASGFDQTELVVPAGERFTICLDNGDTGVQHNFAAYLERGGDLIGKTEIETAPAVQTAELGPLDAGEYWYQCDVHPTTMTGTMVAQ